MKFLLLINIFVLIFVKEEMIEKVVKMFVLKVLDEFLKWIKNGKEEEICVYEKVILVIFFDE